KAAAVEPAKAAAAPDRELAAAMARVSETEAESW
ncbi:MAG: hypothetical protein K0Q63_3473, partial [Paenibacillus sp.]|nr:hypothetical protein [Paenibacillus sp.]